jgi:hypothetical protein
MSWNIPSLVLNYTSGAAVAANRIVKLASDTTVIQGAAAADALIGVTNELAATASGQSLDIVMGGVAEIEAGGSITRGALITSDTVGRAVTATEDNRVIGVALKSASTSDIIPVLLGLSGQVTDSATFVQTGTITTAQLLALYTTEQVVIAAPGTNKAIIVIGATFMVDFASVAYEGVAAGENMELRYTGKSGALIMTIETDPFLTAAADAVVYQTPTSTALIIPVANAAIALCLAAGNIATGDSPLKYKIEYKVIDMVL